jgi:hypothetical protein
VDGERVEMGDPPAGVGEELILDSSSLASGTHAVTAVTIQGNREATVSWQLQVPSSPVLNRAPVVIQAFPPGDFELAWGWVARFHVVAADVDAGDVPSYEWFLDGKRVETDRQTSTSPTS